MMNSRKTLIIIFIIVFIFLLLLISSSGFLNFWEFLKHRKQQETGIPYMDCYTRCAKGSLFKYNKCIKESMCDFID